MRRLIRSLLFAYAPPIVDVQRAGDRMFAACHAGPIRYWLRVLRLPRRVRLWLCLHPSRDLWQVAASIDVALAYVSGVRIPASLALWLARKTATCS